MAETLGGAFVVAPSWPFEEEAGAEEGPPRPSVVALARWQFAGAMASVAQPRPQLFQTSADQSLMANLHMADGKLVLWVRSPLTREARPSWKVHAAVVFNECEPLEVEFDLADRGGDGHIAQRALGAFDETLATRMDKPFALVVEWVN